MAEPERIPFWGGLLHPAHLSLECGCDCINCDEREWCEDEFFKAVMMSAFVRAKLLPTKLTLSIICDRTSSLEIPNAFIVLTSPEVLSSTLIPGEIAAN